jgi:hypothetical protein
LGLNKLYTGSLILSFRDTQRRYFGRKEVRVIEARKLPDFQTFCESKFYLSHRAAAVRDKRGDAKVAASTVFSAVWLMGALGLGALLSVDRMLRTPIGKRWFGRKKPAVSDSTMSRSLEVTDLDTLRAVLYDAYRFGRKQGVSKCTVRCGKFRIGIIDGSGFGRLLASCFEIVGPVSLMVDLEPMDKRGKELPSSYVLLRRLLSVFGKGFVDLILGDGLYLNAPFFNLCLDELGTDVLVKTDDTTRCIIADAMGIFQSADMFTDGITTASGVDTPRMCAYQVMATDGFTLEGVEANLTVAWVRETNIRTGEQTEFWVITSISGLTPEELRELAHWRWDVENNGFKHLNQTVVTKRIYSHNPVAQAACLLILFAVCNLLQIFISAYWARVRDFLGVEPTRRLGIELIRQFVTVHAYLDDG